MIGEKKKVCIKRKIHDSIFSVLIFKNMLLERGMIFKICWVSKVYNGR